MGIIGIDAGGSATKLYDGRQFRQFPSAIGYDWRERNLKVQQGDHDYEWEYNGQRGFAGTLAQYESQMAESTKGDSKAHPDARLRVLLALHQYAEGTEHQIIVGQPIKTHTAAQKDIIKGLLLGRHEITVNGVKRVIVIRRCEVSPEGAAAGLLVSNAKKVRVIDVGSGTVNFGTLIDRRYTDLGSGTMVMGMETVINPDPAAFARQIAAFAIRLGWSNSETVHLCSGGAESLQPELSKHFGGAEIIKPGMTVFANAEAFYLIARKLYEGY